MFEGTREQFMDCFFSNADDEEIKDWCFDNGYKLKIGEENNLCLIILNKTYEKYNRNA